MKDLWTIPIAALVAGVAGLLFGLPALRLSGLYLALATFAIAVATPAVLKRFEGFTGGGSGINIFGAATLTGAVDGVDRLRPHAHVQRVALLPVLDDRARRPRGRVAAAPRPHRARLPGRARQRDRGRSSGVNLALYKTLAFGISAAFAGVAGSLFAIATTFVNPDTFPIALSIFLLVGVVVGGLGSLYGLIAGAIFIYFMQVSWAQRSTARARLLPWLGDLDTSSPGAPSVAFGVVLICSCSCCPPARPG